MRGDDTEFLRATHRGAPGTGPVVRIVDLFAGCGGLSLGVVEAARAEGRAFQVRLAAEQDGDIRAVYGANFQVVPQRLVSDVTQCFDGRLGASPTKSEKAVMGTVGKRLHFLVGGPPCQGHSTLNNHTRGSDPKNELYLRMVRATELLLPAALLVENVPAIERDGGRVVCRATSALERIGYTVETRVVGVAELGVPQSRSRHVLVATRRGRPNLGAAIETAMTEERDLAWAIGDLEDSENGRMDDPGELSPDNHRRARYLHEHGLFDLPNQQRPPCQRGPHKYKSMYGRLHWDKPAQTITTGFGSPGQGRYLHPSRLRTLTPHEAARIQFFPDWFDFGALPHRRQLARAIGNAVPPKLSFVIARSLLSRQSGTKRSQS